jgi:Siphovirus Gp157
MIELDLKKIIAPAFPVSIRQGLPSLTVIDDATVPSIYWQPSAPRLKRQELLTELKDGAEIKGVALSNPDLAFPEPKRRRDKSHLRLWLRSRVLFADANLVTLTICASHSRER